MTSRKRRVREAVAVGREELVVAAEVRLDGLQPLADRRVEPRVDERDPPLVEVAGEQLELRAVESRSSTKSLSSAPLYERKYSLDDLALVAEAEDELVVAPHRVVAHDVPEDRPAADLDHRLGDALGLLAHAHTVAAAEDHDLHLTLLPSSTPLPSRSCPAALGVVRPRNELRRAPRPVNPRSGGVRGRLRSGSGRSAALPTPPCRRAARAISVARFQGRMTIASGRVSAIRSGGWIGMCVPGVNLPCLYGLRSTV